MDDVTISAMGYFAPGQIDGAEFVQIAPANQELPQPPRFTFGKFPPSLMSNYYSLFGIHDIGVFSLRGFELQGVFLIHRDGVYFRCPELNVHETHIFSEIDRIAPGRNRRVVKKLYGPHVVLAGPGYGIYGHWLVEYLPKISLLKFAGFDIHALRYILPADLPSFVFDWLDLLGISPEQIVRYDPSLEIVVADEILLPTVMHNGLRMSSIFKEAAAFLLDLIAAKYDVRGGNYGSRIFLSRAHASQGRSLRNRERVEEIAGAAKFALISPERLSLLEQVRLFVGAREVMGEYGSALHGSMFSGEGAIVCALRGTASHPGFIQSGIGMALRQPTGYVFGEVRENDPNFGFEVSEEDVSIVMRLVFDGLPMNSLAHHRQ